MVMCYFQSLVILFDEIVCDVDLSYLGNEWYWDCCGKVCQEMMMIKGKIMFDQEWVDFEIVFVIKYVYYIIVV